MITRNIRPQQPGKKLQVGRRIPVSLGTVNSLCCCMHKGGDFLGFFFVEVFDFFFPLKHRSVIPSNCCNSHLCELKVKHELQRHIN